MRDGRKQTWARPASRHGQQTWARPAGSGQSTHAEPCRAVPSAVPMCQPTRWHARDPPKRCVMGEPAAASVVKKRSKTCHSRGGRERSCAAGCPRRSQCEGRSPLPSNVGLQHISRHYLAPLSVGDTWCSAQSERRLTSGASGTASGTGCASLCSLLFLMTPQ